MSPFPRLLNDLDRFNLVIDTLARLPQSDAGSALKHQLKAKLIEHKRDIEEHGEDLPEVRNWHWDESAL